MLSSPFLDKPSSEWLASNRSCFAIADGFPVSPGHALIVPRRLIGSWWEASPEERSDIIGLIDEVKTLLEREHGPDGFNVGFNDGEAAGQTVPHFHVHLIPRFAGDTPDPRGGIRHVMPTHTNYLTPSNQDSLELFDNTKNRDVYGELVRLLADRRFDRVDLAVSFIMKSGISLIEGPLVDALSAGAKVRVLATDYMDITDADALARLLDLTEGTQGQIETRVFHDPRQSFHPKAYLFWSSDHSDARGLIGSSNLSRPGIVDGVEWNAGFRQVAPLIERFEALWLDPRNIQITHEWLHKYRESRAEMVAAPPKSLGIEIEPPAQPAKPWPIQTEALTALEETRFAGFAAGLVVMATGLGKTWLAAFDSARPAFRRILFVAHREEILTQSRDIFRKVQPDAELGLYYGVEKQPDARIVFASVQTLSRRLAEFAPGEFDYIVVDEFHHAAASSYRKVIDYFEPQFLLGLTATPERMDGADLLALCDNNLVYRCDLVEAINRNELSPFHYWGIKDVVDFEPIPWRNGRFDPEALTKAVETQERSQQAFDEWEQRAGQRTLGFCCSITHADYMADFFRDRGIRAASVHSGDTSDPRNDSIERLTEGDLDIVFSVDVFNEGLDVPAIDTVLMLRPTESPVLFLQQLGRGLRLTEGKDHLRVVDFIGNHRSFLLKPRILLGLGQSATPSTAAVLTAVREGAFDLPPGCSVSYDLDVIDMFGELIKLTGRSALEEYCRSVFEETGSRPSASQAFRAGLNPASARKSHGHWFAYLNDLGLLSQRESEVVSGHGDVLGGFEGEAITKSFKLVTLRAMLHDGTLRSGDSVGQIASTAHRLVQGDPRLIRDNKSKELPDPARADPLKWEGHWRKWPLAAWAGELSAKTSWFSIDGDRFSPNFTIDDVHGDTFDAMVAELVEYRLGRYLEGKEPTTGPEAIRCKINHSDGRPFVMLDRMHNLDLPDGEDIVFFANGEEFRGDFRKIALNVARQPGKAGNALHALLRGWFGPSAGHPGTRHFVILEQIDGRWVLRPDQETAEDVGATVIPLFANYRVACGAFDAPNVSNYEAGLIDIDSASGPLDPNDYFVAFARGDSMDGGSHPIRHGDPLLFEWSRSLGASDLIGKPVLVEYRSGTGSAQALKILERQENGYLLSSANPDVAPVPADSSMRVVAQLTRKLSQAEINPAARFIGERFKRADIPALYGLNYSEGNWRTGHVSIPGGAVLFVTLNKGDGFGQGAEYVDHFESADTFVWSSQASTGPDGKKGREILEALDTGTSLHLWVRQKKNDVVFEYLGLVVPVSHEGSRPMSVRFRLLTGAPAWV